jgi:hypothetical protein
VFVVRSLVAADERLRSDREPGASVGWGDSCS